MNANLLCSMTACVSLAVLASSKAETIELKIDTSKTGEAISPYIYGQFIEHMGRCIYGGIWAEMLEDRKFFFPITADYSPYRVIENPDFPGELVGGDFPVVGASPWEIVGENASVTMVTEPAHVFVGRHVPKLASDTAIRQHDLGVREGIACEGYLWAKPAGGAAEVEVSLSWGTKPSEKASARFTFEGGEYAKKTFSFTPGATLPKGVKFEIRSLSGDVFLGPPSLMPADNVRGMRADTLALLKQLNGSIYRWPGGNFVSGYDWRDGIGDRDRRPPRVNPAWTGVEHNDFGTDEFMVFCHEVGTEPMIAANTGFGDDYSAAQWVEYCNSDASTIGGGWRVKNGHAATYNVKHWCVGNEMFGPWQLGFMQMQHYVLKHNRFAEAMWKVDPSLQLSAVGDLTQINTEYDPGQVKSGKTCSEIMLEECADHMNILSEHFYVGRVPWEKNGRVDPVTHIGLVREAIRKKADGHRKLQARLPNLKGKLMPITMDEWNYWHREYAYGELGCIYELQDGLGIAAGLHEYFRNSDLIKMAHYAQTVNVIGAIKTTQIAAEMETTGLVLQLYRAHFGSIPLKLSEPPAPYDVTAALSEDGGKLTVSVVNPTSEATTLTLSVVGKKPTGPATRWHITGPDPVSHNTPGEKRVVDILTTNDIEASAPLEIPGLSCSLFEIPIR
ncbi:MAG: alpha-N-arabinofuranosidase [Akkermansiaceae bacterium]|nr:alpha-N-arabinofuranosidase [Akkermansiaceae bacterium]